MRIEKSVIALTTLLEHCSVGQWGLKKVWTEFCPFRPYMRVQINIWHFWEIFYHIMPEKNEDAWWNLQEKFWPQLCATQMIFFIFTLSKTVKYVVEWGSKKVWSELSPFRPHLMVQNNISDIFERLSIRSCKKKCRLSYLEEKFRPYECALWCLKFVISFFSM